MSKASTDDTSSEFMDKELHHTLANEPLNPLSPKTPKAEINLGAGTRNVPSRRTKLIIRSSGLPNIQKTPDSNTSTLSTVLTPNIPQSPTDEIGLTLASPTDLHSTEEIASTAADLDSSLLGAARILAAISRNHIPSPPWLPSRFEDDKWAVDSEGGWPDESVFSSGVDDSEVDSPIGTASTPGFHGAIPANDQVHSQLSAQEASTSGDQAPGLPFPDDRDMLVDYLERGLSLRCLFPKLGSEEDGGIVCLGRLVLIGGKWKRTPTVCGIEEKTLESYQRHVKCIHLRVSRAPQASLALRTIVESWNYKDRTLGSQDKTLWVRRWDQTKQPFPLVEKEDLESEKK